MSNLFCTIRNHRHGEFMDESSIFLELHGLTSSGMALGKGFGFARDEKKQKPTRTTALRLIISREQKTWLAKLLKG